MDFLHFEVEVGIDLGCCIIFENWRRDVGIQCFSAATSISSGFELWGASGDYGGLADGTLHPHDLPLDPPTGFGTPPPPRCGIYVQIGAEEDAGLFACFAGALSDDFGIS